MSPVVIPVLLFQCVVNRRSSMKRAAANLKRPVRSKCTSLVAVAYGLGGLRVSCGDTGAVAVCSG